METTRKKLLYPKIIHVSKMLLIKIFVHLTVT